MPRRLLMLLGLLWAGIHPLHGQARPVPPSVRGFEPSRAFPDRPKLRLRLAGTAVRRRFEADEYLMALYLDPEALATRLPPGPATPKAIARTLAGGEVPFATVAHFLRGVGGSARLKFAREAMARYAPWSLREPEAPDLKAFLAFFSEDLARGDSTEMWVDGQGGVVLVAPRGAPRRIRSPRIALGFATLTFGEPSRDPVLREELLKGVPALLTDRK